MTTDPASELERELLQAAEDFERIALWRGKHSATDEILARAARLRARAAIFTQARENIAETGIVGPRTEGAAELFRSLTGQLPPKEQP